MAGVASNFLSVIYQTTGGGQVVVATTTTFGGVQTTRATVRGNFREWRYPERGGGCDRHSVRVQDLWGHKPPWSVWLPSQPAAQALGRKASGGGRIGLQLPTNARVDNFSGGTLP